MSAEEQATSEVPFFGPAASGEDVTQARRTANHLSSDVAAQEAINSQVDAARVAFEREAVERHEASQVQWHYRRTVVLPYFQQFVRNLESLKAANYSPETIVIASAATLMVGTFLLPGKVESTKERLLAALAGGVVGAIAGIGLFFLLCRIRDHFRVVSAPTAMPVEIEFLLGDQWAKLDVPKPKTRDSYLRNAREAWAYLAESYNREHSGALGTVREIAPHLLTVAKAMQK